MGMVYSMKRYWPLEGVDLPFSPLLPLGLFCPLDTLLPLPGLLVLGVFFPAVSYIKVNIYDKQIWIRTFFLLSYISYYLIWTYSFYDSENILSRKNNVEY